MHLYGKHIIKMVDYSETIEVYDILSTAIAYLCVIDAKHFLNDPHTDKNAIMSSVLIP